MSTDDDNDRQSLLNVDALAQMSHETMMARWRSGLVMPMSATISTFAKTDGAWWKAADTSWHRVTLLADNQRLDFHHDRFGRSEQAAGPATDTPASPWDKRRPQSLFHTHCRQPMNRSV